AALADCFELLASTARNRSLARRGEASTPNWSGRQRGSGSTSTCHRDVFEVPPKVFSRRIDVVWLRRCGRSAGRDEVEDRRSPGWRSCAPPAIKSPVGGSGLLRSPGGAGEELCGGGAPHPAGAVG